MNVTKKILSLVILSIVFSSNIFSVARSGGEPGKASRARYAPKPIEEELGEYYLIEKKSDRYEKPVRRKKKVKPKSELVEVVAKKEKPFKVDLSGYVRLDAFLDSRQNVDYWKGIDYSYPKPAVYDKNQEDINEKAQFTMVPFGKISIKVTGPELRGAKTSAVIKSDIPGKFRTEQVSDHVHDPFGMFRYQHGYLNLEWEKTELLAGVYYSPLVLLELCADTVSINAGEFFDPFNYSSMVRVRHKADPFEFVFAVHKLFWYDQWRDSLAPSLYGQVNVNIGEHLVCGGVNMDVVTPRIETDPALAENLVSVSTVDDFSDLLNDAGSKIPSHGYKEAESVTHFAAFVGTALKKNNVTWKHRLTYAENPFLYTLIGGLGICARNPKTDHRKWTKTRSISYWTELSHMTKDRELGVFFGYTKNLGSRHKLVNNVTTTELLGHLVKREESATDPFIVIAEGKNIDHAFRVQPRIRFFHGPVTIGFEVEYTRAAYGTPNHCARIEDVTNCTKVSNTRAIASVVYAF